MKFNKNTICVFLGVTILVVSYTVVGQAVNNFKQNSLDTSKPKLPKPEIFSSGFIDVVNNGQVNASARLIKLYVGEPGKFQLPLSFYGGVSSNNFQNQNTGGQLLKSNDHLVNQYINPFSGLVNVSIEGIAFRKKDNAKIRVNGQNSWSNLRYAFLGIPLHEFKL